MSPSNMSSAKAPASDSAVPTVILNTGAAMPMVGLGVFLNPPEETAQAVGAALEAGYTLIDTAAVYNNEREVGQALREAAVSRDGLFVTSKLWMSHWSYDDALRGFEQSLDKLGLDCLDLYMLHWPIPSAFDRTLEAYRALLHLVDEGRLKAVGVSNFEATHLYALIDATGQAPAVNQVELHPYFAQPALREANRRRGIVTQAWAPIGGVAVYEAKDPNRLDRPLDNPTIGTIANRLGRSPAQVILRWQFQNGVVTIPKSVNAGRIRSNIDLFDFVLDEADMSALNALDRGVRIGPNPNEAGLTTFPGVVGD